MSLAATFQKRETCKEVSITYDSFYVIIAQVRSRGKSQNKANVVLIYIYFSFCLCVCIYKNVGINTDVSI